MPARSSDLGFGTNEAGVRGPNPRYQVGWGPDAEVSLISAQCGVGAYMINPRDDLSGPVSDSRGVAALFLAALAIAGAFMVILCYSP
jgi:hypothetical protein